MFALRMDPEILFNEDTFEETIQPGFNILEIKYYNLEDVKKDYSIQNVGIFANTISYFVQKAKMQKNLNAVSIIIEAEVYTLEEKREIFKNALKEIKENIADSENEFFNKECKVFFMFLNFSGHWQSAIIDEQNTEEKKFYYFDPAYSYNENNEDPEPGIIDDELKNNYRQICYNKKSFQKSTSYECGPIITEFLSESILQGNLFGKEMNSDEFTEYCFDTLSKNINIPNLQEIKNSGNYFEIFEKASKEIFRKKGIQQIEAAQKNYQNILDKLQNYLNDKELTNQDRKEKISPILRELMKDKKRDINAKLSASLPYNLLELSHQIQDFDLFRCLIENCGAKGDPKEYPFKLGEEENNKQNSNSENILDKLQNYLNDKELTNQDRKGKISPILRELMKDKKRDINAKLSASLPYNLAQLSYDIQDFTLYKELIENYGAKKVDGNVLQFDVYNNAENNKQNSNSVSNISSSNEKDINISRSKKASFISSNTLMMLSFGALALTLLSGIIFYQYGVISIIPVVSILGVSGILAISGVAAFVHNFGEDPTNKNRLNSNSHSRVVEGEVVTRPERGASFLYNLDNIVEDYLVNKKDFFNGNDFEKYIIKYCKDKHIDFKEMFKNIQKYIKNFNQENRPEDNEIYNIIKSFINDFIYDQKWANRVNESQKEEAGRQIRG